MKAVVSEKGQVTIPKAPARGLEFGLGHPEFDTDRGRLIAQKAADRNPVDEVWGTLELGEPVDDFIERVRGR